MDPIEIAVDVKLQQDRRMIGGTTRLGGFYPIEAKLRQIERLHERIDCANRIALIDKIIKAFRRQRRLTAVQCGNGRLSRANNFASWSSGESQDSSA